MATITRFEDLEIWQLSRTFNKNIFPFLQKLMETRNYELCKQIDRAAGSIMDNISEGFERDGNREFIQFLAVSKASAAEVRSQLYRAFDRGLLEEEVFNRFQSDCRLIGEKISRFITYLNHSTRKGKKFETKETKHK